MDPIRRLVDKARTARAQHVERHRPSGFGIALSDSLDGLDPAAWERLTGGASVFLQRPYLTALAEHGPRNLRTRHALVYRGREPLAAVAAQVVEVDGARAVDPGSKRARVLRHVEARLLVCGNLLSWGRDGVALAPGADPAELWPAIAEALYRLRRADRLFGDSDLILVKDLDPAAAAEAQALERFSYRALATEPNMVLELSPKWRRFEDYLAALASKYARSVRGTAEELEQAGCTSELLTDVAGAAEALHALYLQVHLAQPLRLFTLEPGFLPALARAHGDALRVSVIRRGAEFLGFVTTLKSGDTALGWFLGFDKQAALSLPLYLRLLHLSVGDALALGCRRLSLGRTALEPKARLGARPQPLSLYVRHRLPAFNVLLRALLGAVHPEQAPERDPFKKG